ncbi:MAG: hypothetical protein QOJ60_2860 [Actinomycetota bacterium]|nr:hypothetical protein [Actinomycetota bacterium]
MVARAGEVIENPVTGERMTFRRTRADTGGAELEVELELAPGAFLPLKHVHARQEERFTVLAGALRFSSGSATTVLEPGATVAVPAGTPHAWAPAGGDEARVAVLFTPALATELFFESFFALARDGKVNDKGVANVVRMGQLGRAYDVYLAGPSVALQRPVFAALDLLGRLLGYPRLPR